MTELQRLLRSIYPKILSKYLRVISSRNVKQKKKDCAKMKDVTLVITSDFDTHADFICSRMQETGVQVFRFNTNELDRYEIGLKPDSNQLTLLDCREQESVTETDVRSVWYRRPSSDKKAAEMLDEVGLKFFKGETKEWIKSITFAFGSAFWVTAPWLLYKARVKPNQLSVAHEVGLNVPKTLITRDRRLIETFYHECANGVVVKSLKVPFVESEDTYHVLRTQEVTRDDLENPSLYVCPTIFQEKISVLHELRIVAIGRHLFAFKATMKGGRPLDIRSGELGKVEYTPYSISKDMRDKILGVLNHFNLPFSSMDFLVDQDGKEFFVDLNPNGQWLWLEFLTGVVMSDMFIEMLRSGKIPD